MVTIKSNKEIQLMKESCKIAALAQKEIESNIKVGMTTFQLDKIAENVIILNGGIPSFKGYESMFEDAINYPCATCISINNEVIHGIPSKNKYIKEGDVVSIDLGVYKNGFHGDCARTIIMGEPNSEKVKKLVEVTKNSFFEGLNYAKPGYRIGDISSAIGKYIEKNGFSVVREFQGHGVGKNLHEDPGIPNYGNPGKGLRIQSGMTLAIEPMVNLGGWKVVILNDGWTTVTEDGSISAHYENTILITENEPEILTIL